MKQQYYCRIGEKASGPFTVEQLRKLVQEGRINPQTMVCKYGTGDWVQADWVHGLFSTPPKETISPKDFQPTRPSKSSRKLLFVFLAVILLAASVGGGFVLLWKRRSDNQQAASIRDKQLKDARQEEEQRRIQEHRQLEERQREVQQRLERLEKRQRDKQQLLEGQLRLEEERRHELQGQLEEESRLAEQQQKELANLRAQLSSVANQLETTQSEHEAMRRVRAKPSIPTVSDDDIQRANDLIMAEATRRYDAQPVTSKVKYQSGLYGIVLGIAALKSEDRGTIRDTFRKLSPQADKIDYVFLVTDLGEYRLKYKGKWTRLNDLWTEGYRIALD